MAQTNLVRMENDPNHLLDEELRERFDDILERRPSSIHGDGLFARKAFKKGDVIFAFQGVAIDYPKVSADLDRRPKYIQDAIAHQTCQLAGHTIHFRADEQATDFINHSEDPNVLLHCAVAFALRDIAAGEELTVNYRYVLLPHEELLTNEGHTVRPANGMESLRETTAQLSRLLNV